MGQHLVFFFHHSALGDQRLFFSFISLYPKLGLGRFKNPPLNKQKKRNSFISRKRRVGASDRASDMPGSSSFHEQLRILQADITTLSTKLALPGPSAASMSSERDHERCRSPPSRMDRIDDDGAKRAVSKLRREVQVTTRDRDDALRRLEQAYREIEEMRRALQEAARLRSNYDHLRQDHDALRISLESSERIRKQQKALIDLLQKTSSTISDSASVGSYSSYGGSGRGGGSAGGGGSVSTQGVAAENREWLNASPARFMGLAAGAASVGLGGVWGDGGGVAARVVPRLKPRGAGRGKSKGKAEPPSVASTPSRSVSSSARRGGINVEGPSNGGRRIARAAGSGPVLGGGAGPKRTPLRRQQESSEKLSKGISSVVPSPMQMPLPSSSARPRSAPAHLPPPSPRHPGQGGAPSTPLGDRHRPGAYGGFSSGSPSPSPAPSGRPPRPQSASLFAPQHQVL